MKIPLFIALAAVLLPGAATAQTAPKPGAALVKISRLDCGTLRVNDLNAFSDTSAYTGRKMQIVASCYLIRHGDTYMLWDTGLPASAKGAVLNDTDTFSVTLNRTLVEQLAQSGIKPADIALIGVSHDHFDHLGQAASFPTAKLLIGAGDWAALKATPTPFGVVPALAAPWVAGTAPVDPVSGDRDVFGDGSVTMLDLPGHTPGHHGLLVRLTGRTILLTGDTAHIRENYENNGVPGFNTDRAASLASLDRVKGLAKNLNATLVIQHDPRDVSKLPGFPKWAK